MSDRVNYSFAYYTKDNDGLDGEFAIDDSVMRNLTYSSDTTWDVILRDFVNFLSSIYGYDIGESVKIDSFEERLARINSKNRADDNEGWDDEEEDTQV
jgi:hypothetical protein